MKHLTSRIQDHLGFWLGRVSQQVHTAFVAKLKSAAISIPEWSVLIILYHETEPTPAKIAAQVGIDRAAISRTVEKLVQRGFITRTIGHDRRYTYLQLTEKANALIPKLAKLADKNEEEFFFMLEKEEKETLEKILLKVAYQLGIHQEEHS